MKTKSDKLKQKLMKVLNLEQKGMLIEFLIELKEEQIKILKSFTKPK